jgi:hypothetical protein
VFFFSKPQSQGKKCFKVTEQREVEKRKWQTRKVNTFLEDRKQMSNQE